MWVPVSARLPPSPAGNAQADTARTDERVGVQIRHFRRARGLSLRQMAGLINLSVGHLSQIERGVSSASVRTLALAADALGVSVADFFADIEKDEARIVTRVSERGRVKFGSHGVTKELLTVHGEQRGLDLFLIHLGPEDSSGSEAYSHVGIEAGYVISGGFELEVDLRTYVLGEGDSCQFISSRPHRFKNAGQRNALVLWANYRAAQGGTATETGNDLEITDTENRESLP